MLCLRNSYTTPGSCSSSNAITSSRKETNSAAWQRTVEAGKRLLAPPLGKTSGIDFDALRADVASTYNSLGNALDHAGDNEGALAAFERVMWHRNRAGTLMTMGRLDEAATAIERARTLEPEAARLQELEAELEQVRAAAEQAGASEEHGTAADGTVGTGSG